VAYLLGLLIQHFRGGKVSNNQVVNLVIAAALGIAVAVLSIAGIVAFFQTGTINNGLVNLMITLIGLLTAHSSLLTVKNNTAINSVKEQTNGISTQSGLSQKTGFKL
jgi:hypothetical protein